MTINHFEYQLTAFIHFNKIATIIGPTLTVLIIGLSKNKTKQNKIKQNKNYTPHQISPLPAYTDKVVALMEM